MSHCICSTYKERKLESGHTICRKCGRHPPLETFCVLRDGSILVDVRLKEPYGIYWVYPGTKNGTIKIPDSQIRKCIIKGIKYAP